MEQVTKEYGHLDVLINNAGIIAKSPTLIANLREAFETNTFGPAVVTDTFLPLLLKSSNARVIYVTSGLGSITDRLDTKSPYYMIPAVSYRMTKTALNMLAACNHVELGPKGVKVWTYCPGYVVTNLTGTGEAGRQERVRNGAGSAVESAEGIEELVNGTRDADVGKFVKKGGFWDW
jgi:NAD(P)-dependent dehydrogenase (short-subunit alcohol dehydrogenase family)